MAELIALLKSISLVQLIALVEAIGPYVLGLAGIAGTIWGVRHQTKSAEAAALKAEKRAAYAELMGLISEAVAKLDDPLLGTREPLLPLRDAVTRSVGRCSLFRAIKVAQRAQDVADCLTRCIALLERGQFDRVPIAASDLRISQMLFSIEAANEFSPGSRRRRLRPKPKKRKQLEAEVMAGLTSLEEQKSQSMCEPI